ncbi:MAG: DegT/DnrJ/EryC1/StrS family aminotransferase [Thermoplasmata archaeon]
MEASELIPIARPALDEEEIQALAEVLRSGRLAQGPQVRAFEARFADFIGTDHAVATSSGTAALHTALHALGVQPGDEVILPAITFFSSAAMVAAAGGTPVVVDVRAEDYNLEPEEAAKAVTPATTGIMPVHMYGQPAEMGPLRDLAEDKDLFLLEDACESVGATYGGSPVGSLGAAGCFSFYPTKVITTGEGGMVTTNDEAVASACRMFRDHGVRTKYQHEFPGFNYRMTELAAAIGLEQLKKLDGFLKARAEHAARLSEGLQWLEGLEAPHVLQGRTHVWYQYIVRITEAFPLSRDDVVRQLADRGVEARPSYPMAIHHQKAFASLGRAGPCPVAEAALPQMLELPVHPSLSTSDLEQVVNSLREIA